MLKTFRVALRITASSEKMFKRQVQLSLYNMFRSYNLVNLSADKEYLICLEWYLTDNDAVIYSSCISQKTKPFKTVMQSLNAKLAIALMWVFLTRLTRVKHFSHHNFQNNTDHRCRILLWHMYSSKSRIFFSHQEKCKNAAVRIGTVDAHSVIICGCNNLREFSAECKFTKFYNANYLKHILFF